MNTKPVGQRQQILRLQSRTDRLRQHLKVAERGSVLFRADLSYGEDEVLIVEADGLGGATLRVVESNYPVDYFTREERAFSTETEAVKSAATLLHECNQPTRR